MTTGNQGQILSDERRKIMIHRLIWGFILFLGIVIPIIISNELSNKDQEPKIINDNGYINNYYEYINESECEIEIIFDCDVDSGYATVAFYDANGNVLAQESDYFFTDYGNKVSATFYITGKVASYHIISYDIKAAPDYSYDVVMTILIYVSLFVDATAFAFFVCSLLLSYKEYEYNGDEIAIYAGFYHHYIKINGIKYDEHNTLVSHVPIYLSCALDDGTDIQATISLTNRISLKINNRLYTNEKRT